MREIGETVDFLQTLSLSEDGPGGITNNLERCVQLAGEWASSKLKEFSESSITASSVLTRRHSLVAGYFDQRLEDPVPQENIVRIFSHRTTENESMTNLPLGRPNLERDIIQYYQNLASVHFDAGDYQNAESILKSLLDGSEDSRDTDLEWRDNAMMMLATVYCKLGKLQEMDKMVQEKNFDGKGEIAKMLAVSYCRQQMWEDADILLKNQFEGRDETIKTLADEFYREMNWDGVEILLRSEFEGRDTILESLGLAYCEQSQWEKAEKIVSFEFEGKERVMDSIAAGYCQYGKVEEAGEIVLQLLRRRPISTETLNTTHAIAAQCMIQGNFKKAEYYCLTTIKGRETESKKNHSYYKSLMLLTQIYEAQGMQDKAEMHKVLVPKGKILIGSLANNRISRDR